MRVFRHYKGKDYYLLNVAKHTETGEELVIYTDGLKIYARPSEMFYGEVEPGVSRFEEIDTEILDFVSWLKELLKEIPNNCYGGFGETIREKVNSVNILESQ